MKRITLLFAITMLFSMLFPDRAKAQYVRVNIDYKTVAAMVSAYGAETFTEKYYNQQLGNILDRYTTAEVAAAGIFASKYLDRKALTTLGIWGDGTENYYYRRIFNMVSAKIMPKIWTVAGMMLKSPQTALYWGSYLMKICAETKALCYQFESIVTNSTLKFDAIAFLEFNPEIARLLDITHLGGIDWQLMLNDFSNISENFTKENLLKDLDNLYSMASQIVAGGISNGIDQILDKSDFDDLFKGQLLKVVDIMDHYESIYRSLDASVGNTLLGLVGGPENVAQLFNLSNYNLTSWMTDYAGSEPNTYYTQRWYIYWRDAGSEVLCDYTPPTDNDAILYGSAWTRFNTTDANFYPNSSQTEQILRNSESQAGWSRARVNQLNAASDGYRYNISYYRSAYILSKKSKQYAKAYAYSIRVTKSWDNTEEVYEDVFDSYTMDLNTFKKQMNVKLKEFNSNEEGRIYYLGSDPKRYYRATDETKLAGCESVIISVTCHDGAELGSGNTQYKCKTCGSSLNAHSRDCAMKTSVSASDNLDTSSLDAKEQELRTNIQNTQNQIDALERENAQLIRQISSATLEQANLLRQRYNANKDKIDKLKQQLAGYQTDLNNVLKAKEEAAADNDVQTDDHYRIPAIMRDLQSSYSLTWTDAGSWNGFTFTRHATSSGMTGTVTFTASLRIARKPKYFLGIKIHRAIMEINWKLTGEFSDSQVVEILTLDPNMSDADKQKLVNEHISQAARDYPGCDVTTEYIKNDPMEADTTDDVYHLLWASDRLEIARNVEVRLTHIYANLVSLEKMMNYKLSIIDVLKGVAPHVNDNAGRKQTAIQESYERWRQNARLKKDDGGGKWPFRPFEPIEWDKRPIYPADPNFPIKKQP